MIVFEGLKREFDAKVEDDTIAIEIEEAVRKKLGRNTPDSEFASWSNSLVQMHAALSHSTIPDNAGVAIEYNIPLTSKRVDFIISGYDSDNRPGMVIVELKQWSKLRKVASTESLVETFVGGGLHTLVHPSYQAWSYARVIEDYNSAVEDFNVRLSPCAYLHNYRRAKSSDPIDDSQYGFCLEQAPAFTMGQGRDLRAFVEKRIHRGDDKEVLYRIEGGKLRPSKRLQDTILSMMKGNSEFVMIDEQRVVFEKVLYLSEKCQRDGKKRTIICQGGPGTGKSVVAVNLLAELTRLGQVANYTSKNAAPRSVYMAKLSRKDDKKKIEGMFKGSGSYVESALNEVDTILCDEAHRLNEKSGLFNNKGENQIKEIIHASLCSVFFIDESQRVSTKDIGSLDEIRKWVGQEGSEVHEYELVSQFRCNGSDGYLSWIDDVLEIRETANMDLDGIDYDIRILDSPQEVSDLIMEKNAVSNKSRIVAGYCWNWVKEEEDNPDFHDIQIGEWGMSWNLRNGKPFAVSDTSINQVGCIHTTQGLEFDYVGVIIGDDLRFDGSHVITDRGKRASTDQSLKGIKKLAAKDRDGAEKLADEIIRNTYRTLMTRGMKGCYVYCTDKLLSEYLKSRINS